MKQFLRRHRKLLIALGIVTALLLFWWFETFTLAVTRVELSSAKVRDEIKIVQLTDLHGASFGWDNSGLLRAVEREAPDLVAVTGDMHTNHDDKGQETARSLLARLAEKFPVYFVPGEHDHSEQFLSSLEDAGVHVLRDRHEEITIGETRIGLYGIDNVYYNSKFTLEQVFDPLDESCYNILLAHIANFPLFQAFGMDLSLCGDTHGGMVRLPFLGAIQHNGAWFPQLTQTEPYYDKGLFPSGDQFLFVSSGLGNYPFPLRLFNRPEIAVLTIRPA